MLGTVTHNQFGFKPKHGTGMCIFYLDCVVLCKDAAVFSAFLDASKAFDTTNHQGCGVGGFWVE